MKLLIPVCVYSFLKLICHLEAPKRLARRISKTLEEYSDKVRMEYTSVSEEDEESLQSPSSSKYTFRIILYFELQ